jgi:hypothetical protein
LDFTCLYSDELDGLFVKGGGRVVSKAREGRKKNA